MTPKLPWLTARLRLEASPTWPRHWLVLALLSAVTQCVQAQNLSFEQAIVISMARAASLNAKLASVRNAASLEKSAAQLPDPKLTVALDSLPINGPNRTSLTRDDFTERKIGWDQEVPNAAKRAARAEVAQARTLREKTQLQTERLSVRREAGLAWLGAYFAEKRLMSFEAMERQQQLLQQTAPDQLAAGKATFAEVTQIDQEILNMADRRDELQREVDQAQATLRRWVGDIPLTLADQVPVVDLNPQGLRSRLDQSSEITTLSAMRSMTEAEVREAEAAKKGDWGWGVGYAKRGPAYADFISVQLSFEIPLSPELRQEPLIRAKQLELERIDAEREDRLRQLNQEVEGMLAELGELERKLNRIQQQAIPLAQQRIAYALTAYESGRDKLMAVIEARKQKTDAEMRLLEIQGRQLTLKWRLNSIIAEQTP